MSAYIVTPEHIIYLVDAAMSLASRRNDHAARWFWGEPASWQEAPLGNFERAAEVANMLLRENILSVSHRYPGESSATLPGRKGGPSVITAYQFTAFTPEPDPVQVLKSIRCLEYQSCEHPGWEQSEAHAFLRALERLAIGALPGFEEAVWGAPTEPTWRSAQS